MRFAFFILMFSLSNIAMSGFYESQYEVGIRELSARINSFFIDNNVCEDRNECFRKDMFFLGPEKSGLHIEVYNASEILNVEKLISIVFECHRSKKCKQTSILKIYEGSRRDHVGIRNIFIEKKYKIYLEIKGD